MLSFKSFLKEQTANVYHSVFVRSKEPGAKWGHHFDADNEYDAKEEARSQKYAHNAQVKILRVPKHQANWNGMGKDGIHNYVESRNKW
jgi:hypothetical protein